MDYQSYNLLKSLQRVLDPGQSKPWGNIDSLARQIISDTERSIGVKIMVGGGSIVNDVFGINNEECDVDCFVYSGDPHEVVKYWNSSIGCLGYNMVSDTDNAVTFEHKGSCPPLQVITKYMGNSPVDILESFDINLAMIGATGDGYVATKQFTECLANQEVRVNRFTEHTSSRLIKYLCRFGITIREGDLLKAIHFVPIDKPLFSEKNTYAKL